MIQAYNEENTLVINIHSDVGEYSFFEYLYDKNDEESEENNVTCVKDLDKILKKNKNCSKIDIYINSNGGDVYEGIGIYNILKRTRAYKRVFIDGIAASIASVIAMVGNSIYMPKTSTQMVHNAWTYAVGNANELRKTADDLDKINNMIVEAYMAKFKGTREELQEIMDNETFLTADECLEKGFCTKVTDNPDDTDDIKRDVIISDVAFNKQLQAFMAKRRCEIKAMLDIAGKEEAGKPETDIRNHVKEGTPANESEPVNVVGRAKNEEEALNSLQRFFHVRKGEK